MRLPIKQVLMADDAVHGLPRNLICGAPLGTGTIGYGETTRLPLDSSLNATMCGG